MGRNRYARHNFFIIGSTLRLFRSPFRLGNFLTNRLVASDVFSNELCDDLDTENISYDRFGAHVFGRSETTVLVDVEVPNLSVFNQDAIDYAMTVENARLGMTSGGPTPIKILVSILLGYIVETVIEEAIESAFDQSDDIMDDTGLGDMAPVVVEQAKAACVLVRPEECIAKVEDIILSDSVLKGDDIAGLESIAIWVAILNLALEEGKRGDKIHCTERC